MIGAGYLRAGNSAFWIDVSFGGVFEIMVKDRHRQDIFAGYLLICFLPVVSQLPNIMETKRRRFEPYVWSRDDIVCCNCSQLKSRHVHCPCSSCNGAAVARSLEYSHWQQQEAIADLGLPR